MKTAKRLAKYFDIFDQTVGCTRCWEAWWGENATEDMTLFHATTCPLYGRRDVAFYYINLPYAEKHYGRRFGIPLNSTQKAERRAAHLERKKRRARGKR